MKMDFITYWNGRRDGTIPAPKPTPPQVGWWKMSSQISWPCCINCSSGTSGPASVGFKTMDELREHLKEEHNTILEEIIQDPMEKFTTDPKELTLEDRPRVLILEDNKFRNDLFREKLGGKCRLHMHKKAWPAIEAAKTLKFDLILLDHDLGGRQYVTEDAENGTGYDVAKELPNTINKDTPVVIHSGNPVGAQNMLAVLGRTAVYIPFGTDLFKLIKI